MGEPRVRAATAADEGAAAALLHQSAAAVYDRYAGGPAPARRLLEAAFRRPGNPASCEVVTVATVDDQPAAAMAAFPVREATRRANGFLLLTFRRIPPWRWPRAVRIFRTEAVAAAAPPPRALYVDALASAPAFRRRGAARVLLAEAERRGRALGCSHVALDTERTNTAARALYRAAGFEEVAEREAVGRGAAYVSLLKPLG